MKQTLTVGFDAKRIVSNATGLGSYGRTLVNDLATLVAPVQWRLYAPSVGRDDLRSQVIARPNLSFVYPRSATWGKALWRSHGIVTDLQRDGVQVFHGLSGELPVGISNSGVKSVVTIHDLIFLRHPEYYHWLDTRIYAWKFRQTLREADRIVAISECTKRDIVELGHIDPNRVEVIYQSCATRFGGQPSAAECAQLSNHYRLPHRYVLSVGTLEERKNMLLAVKALPLLPPDVHLVCVGRTTPYTARLVKYAEANQLTPRLHLLHGVPDQHLPALYAQADAFVYPSRYEGFGIPIIEAIRQGLPVVACTGSCLEEAGGPHSLYVSPDDPMALAHALSQMLRGAEGRQQRIDLSRDYIRRFDGNDAANKFMQLYQQLCRPTTENETRNDGEFSRK